MIAHSMLTSVTAVVMPLVWCPVCEGQRPAAGAPGQLWRCRCCGQLHHGEVALIPATFISTSKEASA